MAGDDLKSAVPAFRLAGVIWECWVVDGGSYVWRSRCGRLAAGREGRSCWVRYGMERLGGEHGTLKLAMLAGVLELRRRGEA